MAAKDTAAQEVATAQADWTGQRWQELLCRQQAGAELSAAEQQHLARALALADNAALLERWARLERALPQLLALAEPEAVPSVAAPTAQAIALSAALRVPLPAMSASVAPRLSRQIAAEVIPHELQPVPDDLAQWHLTQWLRAQPAPALPRSVAARTAQAIAQEAHTPVLPAAILPAPAPVPALRGTRALSVLAGLNGALACGGLLSLPYLAAQAQGVVIQPKRTLGLLASSAPLPTEWLPTEWLAALASPWALAGLAAVIVSSALLLWQGARRVGVVGLLLGVVGLLGLLGLPGLLGSAAAHRSVGAAWPFWGVLVLAGLAVQMALLLAGGQAGALTTRQSHFPLQALGAGLLAVLGLAGSGALLLAVGQTWALWLLGAVLLLGVLVGLGVSLLSLGRGMRSLLPAAPRWLAGLASLGVYGTSLALPPLAAVLLLLGGAWGLGSVLLPRSPARSAGDSAEDLAGQSAGRYAQP